VSIDLHRKAAILRAMSRTWATDLVAAGFAAKGTRDYTFLKHDKTSFMIFALRVGCLLLKRPARDMLPRENGLGSVH
jgi:hypothetical protein